MISRKKKGKPALHMLMNPTIKEPKKTKTGEWDLFIEIANERQVNGYVEAKHRDFNGKECTKMIRLEDLSHWNFSHTKKKGMHKELRLDPSNIEIVSVAWHFYEENKLILKVHYKN